MRFFTSRIGKPGHYRLEVLRELVDYEYFEPAPENPEYDKKAALFSEEMDFAWFVAKFGWSKAEYNQITPVERRFIKKEYESDTVERQALMQSTFELAIANVMRKKGKKYKKLFKRIKKIADDQPLTRDEAKQVKRALAKLMGIPTQKKK